MQHDSTFSLADCRCGTRVQIATGLKCRNPYCSCVKLGTVQTAFTRCRSILLWSIQLVAECQNELSKALVFAWLY
jgi:hypothetical protein